MRLRLFSVGRERADDFAPMVADYAARIAKFVPFEDVVIRPNSAERIRDRMLEEAKRADLVVAFDERGTQPDSPGLAAIVSSWMDRGVKTAALFIGGAEGLDERILSRADLRLSLSRLTLPHRIARLVATEQIYRALCIVRKVPYQK